MKRIALLLVLLMLTGSASATVRIIVEDVNGLAAIKYETTEEEPIRAFALDITVCSANKSGTGKQPESVALERASRYPHGQPVHFLFYPVSKSFKTIAGTHNRKNPCILC